MHGKSSCASTLPTRLRPVALHPLQDATCIIHLLVKHCGFGPPNPTVEPLTIHFSLVRCCSDRAERHELLADPALPPSKPSLPHRRQRLSRHAQFGFSVPQKHCSHRMLASSLPEQDVNSSVKTCLGTAAERSLHDGLPDSSNA